MRSVRNSTADSSRRGRCTHSGSTATFLPAGLLGRLPDVRAVERGGIALSSVRSLSRHRLVHDLPGSV